MSKFDTAPDELGLDWQEDVIYCEATCRTEDVYYEGSEDEDYDDPEIRRQRYENAGQRFLEGNVPLLLSARLRGPFDKDSGWTNPWRSKYRTARQMRPQAHPSTTVISQQKHIRNASMPQSEHAEIPDSMDCHLPSPESLKQAPVTDAHPFLETDELAKVQQWRSSISEPQLTNDAFWTSKSPLLLSVKKRRAKGSDWLKKIASKRRKTDIMDTDSTNTPLQQRGQDRSRGYTSLYANASFGSAPGRINSPADPPKRKRSSSDMRKADASSEPDELTVILDSSFKSAPGRLNSPPKRISPKRDVCKGLHTAESEDELSQQKIASAKLSSPVSASPASQQGHYVRMSRRRSILRSEPNQPNLANGSPSREKRAEGGQAVQAPMGAADGCDVRGADTDHEIDTDNAAFTLQTQQDQSFCFKVRHNVENGDKWVSTSLKEAQIEVAEDDVPPQSADKNTQFAQETADCTDATGNGIEDYVIAKQLERPVENAGPEEASEEPSPANDTSVDVESGDEAYTLSNSAYAPEENQRTKKTETQSVTTSDDAMRDASPSLVFEDPVQNSAEDHLPNEDMSMGDCESADQSHLEKKAEALDHSQAAVELPNLENQAPVVDSENDVVKAISPEQVVETGEKEVPEPFLKGFLHGIVSASPWAKLSQLTSRSSATPVPETTDDIEQMDETTTNADIDEITQSSVPNIAVEGDNVQTPQGEISAAEVSDIVVINSPAFSTPSSIVTPMPPHVDRPGHVTQDVTEVTEVAETPEHIENTHTTLSQQSPWAKSQLSQRVAWMNDQRTSKEDAPPVIPVSTAKDMASELPSATQSPWANHAEILPAAGDDPSSGAMNDVVMAEAALAAEKTDKSLPPVPPFLARPSTPEPQFAVKSFASFMSPSPERIRQKRTPHQGLTSRSLDSQGGLASAMKGSWVSESNKRVSWASLPDEESTYGLNGSHAAATEAGLSSRDRGRQASPPPVASLADLPTSENAKFRKHFTAVASRTDGLRQRLLPPASQQTQHSPDPYAMAEKFLSVDEVANTEMQDVGDTEMVEGAKESQREIIEYQEPMDIVEDVLRDMGDFWQTWDVDAELDQARKTADPSSASDAAVESQGGW